MSRFDLNRSIAFAVGALCAFAVLDAIAQAQQGQQAPWTRPRLAPSDYAPSQAAPTSAAQQPLGAPPWKEDFEGPTPTWQDAGGDTQYTFAMHLRVHDVFHSGHGSEMLRLDCQSGSTVYIGHDIGRPAVIDDLLPSVWVLSDRPGLQFFAEITLPRTLDPSTGKPVVAQIFGASYSDVGRWQQLRIEDIARRLPGQIRVKRSQMKANVDGGQAYINRVLLNVYGGPGATNVWIDELQVLGHVPAQGLPTTGVVARPVSNGQAPTLSQQEPMMPTRADGNINLASHPAREVKLEGPVLTVNGYPIFPRAIEYRGEHLQTLQQLGFNTVWFQDVPSVELRQEASRLGLWIICPPPQPLLTGQSGEAPAPDPIGDDFDQVLVWNLGSGLTSAQVDASKAWANQTSLADARRARPTICSPVNTLRAYSRFVKYLLIDRRPLGSSLQMQDYGAWVQRQPLLAVPGTPVWTTIQTQPSEGLRRQLVALSPSSIPPNSVAPEQMRLMVCTAISSGSRGLLFLSNSSLEASDAETQQRAAALQLLNLEVDVIEPWAAGGTSDTEIGSNQPMVTGTILRSGRARIVMPLWLEKYSQCVAPLAAATAAKPLQVYLPGVPESSQVFEITPGRLEPLRYKGAAGGTAVTLDEFGLSALLVAAQDAPIIEAITRRVSVHGQQMAALERQLATRKLQTTEQTLAALGRHLPAKFDPASDLTKASKNLSYCDAHMAAGDFSQASTFARRAMKPLRFVERVAWEGAMQNRSSTVESPGTAAFATLPWHWELVDRMASWRLGPNRLVGGDFENLDVMNRAGWRHYERPTADVQSYADLMPDAAHAGQFGLQLTARPVNPVSPPAVIESPPIWITSPAVMVQAGQTVRIHGWVQIPLDISGSVDGLIVFDSLSGEDMADRIYKTGSWREFNLVRAVPQSGPMTVTFALTGLGKIRLDDISIAVLEPGFAPAIQAPH